MHSESGGWVRRRRLRGGGMDVESPSELADQAGHREEAGAAAENPPSGTAHGLGRYAMATEEVTNGRATAEREGV